MTPIPHPIHLAPHSDGPAPHSYLIWKKAQLCTNCGTLHEWSEVYAKTHLAPQFHQGKYVTNLRPLHSDPPAYNLPVEIREADMHKLPFCHSCSDPHRPLEGLPFPPTPKRDLPPPPSWLTAVAAEKPRAKPAGAQRPKTTLDDLFALLPTPKGQPE